GPTVRRDGLPRAIALELAGIITCSRKRESAKLLRKLKNVYAVGSEAESREPFSVPIAEGQNGEGPPMRATIIPTALLAFAVAACSSPESEQEQPLAEPVETEAPLQAVAMLVTADGTEVGRATAMPDGDSVAIALNVEGMTPGEHGVHVHETGSCVGPDFTSAGSHWN